MSFSIPLDSLFTYAGQMFNALSPVVVLIGGLGLGAGIAGFVLAMIMGLFKGRKTF